MVDYKVVAIGVQGAGKTSLFNKICSTKANVSGELIHVLTLLLRLNLSMDKHLPWLTHLEFLSIETYLKTPFL